MSSLVTHALAADTGHPTNKLLLVVIAGSLKEADSGLLLIANLSLLCSVHVNLVVLHLHALRLRGFISYRIEDTDDGEAALIDIKNWKFTLPESDRGLLH